MAATIVGATNLTWGGSSETISVWTSFSQTSDSEKVTVQDEDGDFVTAAYFGKKSVAQLSGFLKGTAPTIGASISLANATAGLGGVTGTFYVDSVAVSKAPNNFNEVSVSATNHGF